MKKLLLIIVLLLTSCVIDEPFVPYIEITDVLPYTVNYNYDKRDCICKTGFITLNNKEYQLYWPNDYLNINVGTTVLYESHRVIKYKNSCKWIEVNW